PPPSYRRSVLPFSGQRQRLAAVDAMRHDRGQSKIHSRRQCGSRQGRPSMKRAITGMFATVLAMSATAALAQGKPPLKLGGILDMSGLYADITGTGSETAAKMAVEDFGRELLGRNVELVAAGDLNEADLPARIARVVFD